MASLPQISWPQLIWTSFIARPNRFLVQVKTDEGEVISAYMPDPSRMKELLITGVPLAITPAGSAKRKTAFDAVLVRAGAELVSVDTRVPNNLAEVALKDDFIAELTGYSGVKREVTVGRSRFDFELSEGLDSHERCLLEVKSASLVEDGVALFPDAVTARGKRHVEELTKLRESGVRTVILFIIQRGDAVALAAHAGIDPQFASAFEKAISAGVEVLAYSCKVTEREIAVDCAVPVLRGWPPV